MSFDIDDTTTVWAAWHFEFRGPRPGNFLAMIMRDADDRPWYLQYRFRYYVDDKIFESDDDRSWFRAELGDETPVAEREAQFADAAVMFAGAAPGGPALLKHVRVRATGGPAIVQRLQAAGVVNVGAWPGTREA